MGRSKRRGEPPSCGKLKPGQGGHPVAVWHWARLDWRRAGLDPQGATQLGRLGLIGQLNEIEVAVVAGTGMAGLGRLHCDLG